MRNSRFFKAFSIFTLICFLNQLIFPLTAFALTGGPSQPEVQSFEPIETSQMVDPFTGDMSYNIPLLDVEGYPINISYHSNITMEDEASWVGLGWNLNPGVMNRSVRGIPDDFKGDEIKTIEKVKDNTITEIEAGAGYELFGIKIKEVFEVPGELAGELKDSISTKEIGSVSLNANLGIRFDNFKGVGLYKSIGIPIALGPFSFTPGLSYDSQGGVNLSGSFSFSKRVNDDHSLGLSAGFSTNSRSGVVTKSMGGSLSSVDHEYSGKGRARVKLKNGTTSRTVGSANVTFTPVGFQTYTPYQRVPSNTFSVSADFAAGYDVIGNDIRYDARASFTRISQEDDPVTDKAFGYLFSEFADNYQMMDFNRERNGAYKAGMPNLPLGFLSYDVFATSAQGSGGTFRPYLNKNMAIRDPYLSNKSSENIAGGVELSPGIKIGGNISYNRSDIQDGGWWQASNNFDITNNNAKDPFFYESYYFKNVGEKNLIDTNFFVATKTFLPVSNSNITANLSLGTLYALNSSSPFSIPNLKSHVTREYRSKYLITLNGDFASKKGAGFSEKILSMTSNVYKGALINQNEDQRAEIDRFEGVISDVNNRKDHHLSEMIQVNEDGTRYIYGIPAMNLEKHELSFNAEGLTTLNGGLVQTDAQSVSTGTTRGINDYYKSVITPAYAHSYLLTGIIGADYIDISGNGITDDDLGNYTKFNYQRTTDKYKWRFPFEGANLMPGSKIDKSDDVASITYGVKELWYLTTIETRNFVCEFYISPRADGVGVGGTYPREIGGNPDVNISRENRLMRLDSIKLFNKFERLVDTNNTAQPIKTIVFEYDYTNPLCPGISNYDYLSDSVINKNPISGAHSGNVAGKLTLKKIYIIDGSSNKGYLIPYTFNYANNNPYSNSLTDRWGMYKGLNSDLDFIDFPFTNQSLSRAVNNGYAASWLMNEILLPSGGKISIDYEADDYAYVQDKLAAYMKVIAGVGNTTTFKQNNELYTKVSDVENTAKYVYIKADEFIGSGGIAKAEDYVNNIMRNGVQHLFFDFDVALIQGASKKERIQSYAEIVSVGICPGSSDNSIYLYYELKPQPYKKSENKKMSGLLYSILTQAQYQYSALLFKGQKLDQISNDEQDTKAIKEQTRVFKEILGAFRNKFNHFVSKKNCKTINIATSWVRMNSLTGFKVGGGARVKKIVVFDNWNDISNSTNEQIGEFGTQYDYTTTDPIYGGKISSGVAQNEPSIGLEESALKQPKIYAGVKQYNLPRATHMVETPVGESLFPGASVGYSQVTITNIHQDKGRSAQGISVQEFYTAKDFPVQVIETPIKADEDKDNFGWDKSTTTVASQGYSIILNNMHGKPKASSIYSGYGDEPVLISKEVTKYHTKIGLTGKEALNNKVPVLLPDGKVKLAYVGIDYDINTDSRFNTEKSTSTTLNANVDILIWPIPLPITVFYPVLKTATNTFASVVTTKIISEYGIVESITKIDFGSQVVVKNTLYDAQTGEAILTEVQNAFGDNIYNLNLPAYYFNDRMAPMFKNMFVKGTIQDLMDRDVNNNNNYLNHRLWREIKIGDKLLITNGDQYDVMHVTRNRFSEIMGKTMTYASNLHQDNYEIPNDVFGEKKFDLIAQSVINPRNCITIDNGVLTQVRVQNPTNNTDITGAFEFIIIDSGNRNLISESGLSLSSFLNPIVTKNEVKSLEVPVSDLLAYNIKVFEDDLESGFGPSYGDLNENYYISGQIGRFVNTKAYSIFENLKTDGGNRKNGTFNIKTDPIEFKSYNYNNIAGLNQEEFYHPSYILKTWTENDLSRLQNNIFEATALKRINKNIMPIEMIEKNGIYTSNLICKNGSDVLASAANAKESEIFFESFEEFGVHFNEKFDNSNAGFINTLDNINDFYIPFKNPFMAQLPLNTIYYKLDEAYTANTKVQVIINDAHTGKYALKIKTNSAIKNTISQGVITPEKKFIASIWVKAPSSPNANFKIEGNHKTGVSSSSWLPFKAVTPSINGWVKYELVFEPETQTSVPEIRITNANNYLIDDIRIMPNDANMKCYVYDNAKRRLMSELDENHFASFYEYENDGSLVRIKKETERGVLTIQESRKVTRKTITQN